MPIDLAFATKVFAALFAITNPIANIPVFLSLTEGASDAHRRRIALVASIGAAIGCIISTVAGAAILNVFGLTVDDFRLAGGLR
jgi:multiple antibiotic resistance protein